MDTVLGLFGLLVYMTAVIGTASAITFAVVKLSPSKAVKDQQPKPAAD